MMEGKTARGASSPAKPACEVGKGARQARRASAYGGVHEKGGREGVALHKHFTGRGGTHLAHAGAVIDHERRDLILSHD